jgi:hypothetical protein
MAELFGWGEEAVDAVNCVGFDSEPATPCVEIEEEPAPATSRPRRRAKARADQAPAESGDLFLPAAVLGAPAERRVPPLPLDLQLRMNAYYAPRDRLSAILPDRERRAAETRAEPRRLSRLGHFFTALVGA